jgi:alpha-1,2-rhamnosyltransferase
MSAKIFIDVTLTYYVDFTTGIQRVVRNIVKRKDLISGELQSEVVFVVFDGVNYITIDDISERYHKIQIKDVAKRILGSKVKNKNFYNFAKLCYKLLRKIKFFTKFVWSKINLKKKTLFESGDVLFIADSYYNPDYRSRYYRDTITSLKKSGVKVMLLVYDIIAMTDPKYFDDYMTKELDEYFKYFLDFTDVLITISQSEKVIIEKYLNRLGIKRKVDYFYLGCDLEKINNSKEDLYAVTEKYKPYFLVVGTLEPRKGHEIVLSAFEKLWEEGCRYNLVFTGRIGWKVDRLLERINNSKYLNKRFFVLNDVADELLIALYKNAYACICATMREGFGLPLVESIHFDKPVIASDIEVDKEVGNGYPVYFKSGDPDDLAQSISHLIKSCSNNEKSNFKPLTWDDSVKMISQRIKKFL